MCGRYSLFAPPEDIEERFDAVFAEAFQPRYNAAPGQSLPVVADDRPDTVDEKEWGFVPPWADDRSDFGFVNARAETLTEKPTFRAAFARESRDGFRMGRCLVPADGFYEWVETDGGKQPYRVTLADERPFAMAGLWAQWQPPQAQTGLDAFAEGGDGNRDAEPETVETFTVVTTEPNDLVSELHHRMAVILPEGTERRWLTGSPDEVQDLLEPYGGEMDAYPVSTAVNDPANDSPDVVERVETE